MRRVSCAIVCTVLLVVAGTQVAADQNRKSGTKQSGHSKGRPFVGLRAQINALQQQIDDLKSSNATQDQVVAALGAGVLSLEADIAGAQASIEDLQAHDRFVNEWMAGLDSRWREAESRLAASEYDLRLLVDADQALQVLLASLRIQADSLETRLGGLDGQVTTLSSSLASELAAVNAAIGGLQLDVDRKQAGISQACAPGSSIRQINAATGAVTCEIHSPSSGSVGRLSMVEVVTGLIPISAGGTGTSSAFCPSGYVVTGGGYQKAQAGNVYADSPTGNGWMVGVQNPGTVPTQVRAFARCAPIAP